MKQNRAGFTLIELLTVITIMAIIMGLVVGVGHLARTKALTSRTQAELEQIANVLNEYQVRNGVFPTSLTTGGANSISNNLPENIDTIDAWHHTYEYIISPPYMTYNLFSRGPNDDPAFVEDNIVAGRQ